MARRRCPLAPQLYRQQAVRTAEGMPFASKIDLMAERIRGFEPAAETHTHVLLDSWYSAKAIWSSAHARGFDSSCGLKANRLMRINDPEAKNGWRRQDLRTYAGRLTDADYQEVVRPQQEDPERSVWAHTLTTIVRNLGRCQVILVRDSLTAPVKEVRFWASSDLDADAATLIPLPGRQVGY